MKIEKKHILIGLGVLTLVGAVWYYQKKKKGAVKSSADGDDDDSSADGDDDDSNFISRYNRTDFLKDSRNSSAADGNQSMEIGTPNVFATVQGAFGKTPVIATNPYY